jgi:hypothetical protein
MPTLFSFDIQFSRWFAPHIFQSLRFIIAPLHLYLLAVEAVESQFLLPVNGRRYSGIFTTYVCVPLECRR